MAQSRSLVHVTRCALLGSAGRHLSCSLRRYRPDLSQFRRVHHLAPLLRLGHLRVCKWTSAGHWRTIAEARKLATQVRLILLCCDEMAEIHLEMHLSSEHFRQGGGAYVDAGRISAYRLSELMGPGAFVRDVHGPRRSKVIDAHHPYLPQGSTFSTIERPTPGLRKEHLQPRYVPWAYVGADFRDRV